MKSWIKKMKRLFAGNSTNTAMNASNSNMMTESFAQISRHRKLPPVPSKSNTKEYACPTYGAAENYIKKNRCLLEQTLEMIELYPELLKHSSCNKLVDFMTKLGIKISDMPKTDLNKTLDDDNCSSVKCHMEISGPTESNVTVPEILVSHAQDDELLCSGRSSIVFICGNFDDTNWHRLLVGLSRVYSVHCFSPKQHFFSQNIQISDVLLFLMDEISVNDHRYTEQLHAAITKGVEIVYVRDMSFELKEQSEYARRFNSKTSRTFHSMRSQELTTSLTDLKHFPNRSRCTSLDNFSIDSDDSMKHDYVTPQPCTLNTDQRNTLSASSIDKRPSTPKQSFDISKILQMEYGTAHGYHQIYHSQCLERIVINIDSKIHILSRAQSPSAFSNASQSLLNTRTSMYSSVSNDSAIDDMYHSLSPDIKPVVTNADVESGVDDIYPSNRESPTHSETVFLVSKDAKAGKPVLVRWPTDAVENESLNSSPSIDSFGFQDVDLSKRINQLDLFESSHSDE